MDEIERNKAAVRSLVEAINGQEWSRLDELVAVDFVRTSPIAENIERKGESPRVTDPDRSLPELDDNTVMKGEHA